ncbi:hypothetical protein MLD38_000068 [Melastoma candidum]|uniref:Uncharacterized protein n=1 Tax=Melastoma candidum TaxID=119954 RepID=A0ACB9SC64_9MYRT|nr:hypothetical protein MLD38_000068 [Melastoma candidum]
MPTMEEEDDRGYYFSCLGDLLRRRFSRGGRFLNPIEQNRLCRSFKGREKMQARKLNMIADDNKGGCPNTRKNGSRNLVAGQENGILQAPGLVARLMGLESMPLGQQKLRKNFHRDQKQEKVVRRSGVVRKEDIVEKGETEPGSILPKTRESDRQVATQFGAEALQIKNVLSRSMKHRRQNFSIRVKSPWVAPAHRNSSLSSSRLIDVANKILEPGLQNKSRIKCALPYSSVVLAASAETLTRRSLFPSSDMPRQKFGSECLANTLSMKQSSCKNCGHLLESSLDCGQHMLEQKLNTFDIALLHLDNLHHKHVWIAPSTGASLAEDHNDRPVKDVVGSFINTNRGMN